MIKKISIITILLVVINFGLVLSVLRARNSNFNYQAPNQIKTNVGKKLELFVGLGYFNPSFKQWNDRIDELNGVITQDGYSLQSDNIGHLESQSYYNFGVKYYFNQYVNLSLSIGSFKANAMNDYTTKVFTKEQYWPNRDIQISEQLTFKQNIRMNPTLLTLSYNIPFYPLKNIVNFYIGAGLGYYFSSIKNEALLDFNAEFSNGKGIYADSVSVETANILANIQTKANPLGYHLLMGCNIYYRILQLNFELGYNFATAKIKKDDWIFFTQKENYFELPEDTFDELRINRLDFGGLIVKAGIGILF